MICRSGCRRFVKFKYAENPESKFLYLYMMHNGLYLSNEISDRFETLTTVKLRYLDLIYALKIFFILVRRSRVLSNPVTILNFVFFNIHACASCAGFH